MPNIRLGLDLYGGDNAPESTIQGAIFAIENYLPENAEIHLFGEAEGIGEKVAKYKNIRVIKAENQIDNNTKPIQVRRLPESSIYKGCLGLANKEIDAFISAGNTGALLAGGTFISGRLPGIKRPALALALPAKNNKIKILVDAGANAEVKPEFFYDFARIGIAYSKFMGTEDPKIAIMNIGTEEEKGSNLVKEASKILKENNLNYVGYREGRDIFNDDYDVALTDGFTGNMMLKTIEGTSYYIVDELKEIINRSSIFTKIGALMMKKALKGLKGKIDYRQYGGTFFLGVNGILVKAHGSSDPKAIANALNVAYKAVENKLIDNILI
ncbi:MAG: phosphate acyltransferase PlsX [Thermotogae bacterium]|nr:phosphate acyltransferase PlsX [Thermotogota bacterium]MCP5465452.1 phosphate acyltransferase PlsX [Thermotogota bacterium]HOO75041.1 phosphate acyltransferase PlsX [Tepiditoga sp.]